MLEQSWWAVHVISQEIFDIHFILHPNFMLCTHWMQLFNLITIISFSHKFNKMLSTTEFAIAQQTRVHSFLAYESHSLYCILILKSWTRKITCKLWQISLVYYNTAIQPLSTIYGWLTVRLPWWGSHLSNLLNLSIFNTSIVCEGN